MRHQDNLKTEGVFQSRQLEEWAPGERAPVVKRPDNLKSEGKFQEKQQDEWTPGQYAQITIYNCLSPIQTIILLY